MPNLDRFCVSATAGITSKTCFSRKGLQAPLRIAVNTSTIDLCGRAMPAGDTAPWVGLAGRVFYRKAVPACPPDGDPESFET